MRFPWIKFHPGYGKASGCGNLCAGAAPNPNYKPRVNLPFTLYVLTGLLSPQWGSNKASLIAKATKLGNVKSSEESQYHVYKVVVRNQDDILDALNMNLNPQIAERIYTA